MQFNIKFYSLFSQCTVYPSLHSMHCIPLSLFSQRTAYSSPQSMHCIPLSSVNALNTPLFGQCTAFHSLHSMQCILLSSVNALHTPLFLQSIHCIPLSLFTQCTALFFSVGVTVFVHFIPHQCYKYMKT